MKFDLIISNPPYNRGLDLKILKNIYNLSNRICFIHPLSWLYDNKNKNNLFVTTKKLVRNNIYYIDIIKNANKIFGISNFTDIGITYFNKNNKCKINIDYIDMHGASTEYKGLKNKILKYKNNLDLNCQYSGNTCNKPIQKTKLFDVGFSTIGCNVSRYDFYTIIRKGVEHNSISKNSIYRNKSHAAIFEFESKIEANNFKDYLKLKITRFCLSIYKISQDHGNGELASVPYMPTYKHEWNDEMIAKELNLTDEELRWAINWIPNYYEEDEEKYKKYEI